MARKSAAPAAPTTAYIIDKMDAKACDVLRPVIDEALKAALAPYGVTASIGKITYHETGFRTTLEVETASNGEAQFKQLVTNEPGVKMEWFGQTFELKGEQWRVVGADLGRSKYPVKIQRVSDGHTSGLTTNGLRAQFDKDALEAEQRKAFSINLKIALELSWEDDYASLVPHATTLAVGAELPNSGGTKILGLLKHPFDVKFKKNSLVVEQNGTLGLYKLPYIVDMLNTLAKPKAA